MHTKRKQFLRIIILAGLCMNLVQCDPDHKSKCEWYLIPDIDKKGKAEEGYIRVCARNFVVHKQDCRLQSTFEFAKSAYQKKFRYHDLEWDSPGIPRTITSLEFCE